MNSFTFVLLIFGGFWAMTTAQESDVYDVNWFLDTYFGPNADPHNGIVTIRPIPVGYFAANRGHKRVSTSSTNMVSSGSTPVQNRNNHNSVSASHTNTVSSGSTSTQNKNDHNVGANVFYSTTSSDNGAVLNKFGGGLSYSHPEGHSLSVEASRIPQLNLNTLSAEAKANLLNLHNGDTTLDLTGTISKNIGGPSNGGVEKNIRLELKSKF